MNAREHEEVKELLGAYALDAVDADEAELLDDHLQDCPSCTAEVNDFREVAGMLAHTGADAPPQLWERIRASLDEAPPPVQVQFSGERRGRSRWVPVAAGGLAAAAAAVIVVLGIAVVRQGDDIDQLEQALEVEELERAAEMAFADPRTTTVELTGEELQTAAALTPDGQGFLRGETLPALEPDRTYQLWGRRGEVLISLGVLGADPSTVGFHAEGPLDALLISSEAAGGSPSPQGTVLASGETA